MAIMSVGGQHQMMLPSAGDVSRRLAGVAGGGPGSRLLRIAAVPAVRSTRSIHPQRRASAPLRRPLAWDIRVKASTPLGYPSQGINALGYPSQRGISESRHQRPRDIPVKASTPLGYPSQGVGSSLRWLLGRAACHRTAAGASQSRPGGYSRHPASAAAARPARRSDSGRKAQGGRPVGRPNFQGGGEGDSRLGATRPGAWPGPAHPRSDGCSAERQRRCQ